MLFIYINEHANIGVITKYLEYNALRQMAKGHPNPFFTP